MDERYRIVGAVSLVLAIFLVVQLGALSLVSPFEAAGYQQVEDPQDPTNSLVYVAFILVATGVMLAAFRYGFDRLIRAFVVFVSGMLSVYVFSAFVHPTYALGAGAVVAVALLLYPEWYVIDAAGALMGAGAAGLFGISFGILPALVLLTVLAVYDAISVYGTEHMLTLAEGVMDLKVPVVLVVPTTLSYSFLDAGGGENPDAEAGDGSSDGGSGTSEADGGGSNDAEGAADERPTDVSPLEREALFVGLGDAVMPAILVASAAHFLTGATGEVPALAVPGVVMNLPALGAIIGTNLGLLVLMWMVLKGRAHAGLPLLNGGAILGYLVGALAVGVPLGTALGL